MLTSSDTRCVLRVKLATVTCAIFLFIDHNVVIPYENLSYLSVKKDLRHFELQRLKEAGVLPL